MIAYGIWFCIMASPVGYSGFTVMAFITSFLRDN